MTTQMLGGLLVLAGALFLHGCAARKVTPVQMVQPGDANLRCADMERQIANNRVAIAKLLHKDKQVEGNNIAKSIGSAIPGVGLLLAASIDLSNEEQIKARALIDRNERLTMLEKQEGCEN